MMIRRCGAMRPNENGNDDWFWCEKTAVHGGPHVCKGMEWLDGEVVEVTTVEVHYVIYPHQHDFVGDQDYCVARQECPMTWHEHRFEMERWARDHSA